MNWPPGGRGAPVSESAPVQTAANHDRKSTDKPTGRLVDSGKIPPIELNLLAICERSAAQGRELPCNKQIVEELGAGGPSTIATALKRLEGRGLVRRTIFQRGRVIQIVATGEITAQPRCTQPHWRERRRAANG